MSYQLIDIQTLVVSRTGINKTILRKTREMQPIIDAILGKPTETFVYPKGYAARVIRVLKLYREIQKLKTIKNEITLILNIKTYEHNYTKKTHTRFGLPGGQREGREVVESIHRFAV